MTKHPLSDLDGEIRDHIERETDDNIARGMPPREARHAALRKFGSVALAQEECPRRMDSRLARSAPAGAALRHPDARPQSGIHDRGGRDPGVRHRADDRRIQRRQCRADPPLALRRRRTDRAGAGNLPADRAMPRSATSTIGPSTARCSITRRRDRAATYNLADDGDPERIRGMRVTPGYFEVAHMPPALGRYFTASDVDLGGRVVVLSHSLWQARFGGDRAIIGRSIRLGDESHTVIGVAPAAYALTDPDPRRRHRRFQLATLDAADVLTSTARPTSATTISGFWRSSNRASRWPGPRKTWSASRSASPNAIPRKWNVARRTGAVP